MAKRVPYTIQRNGIYWLNIYWYSCNIRLSLNTRDSNKAMTLSAFVKTHINALRKTEEMSVNIVKDTVRKWLDEQTEALENVFGLSGFIDGPMPNDHSNGTPIYSTFMELLRESRKDVKNDLDTGNWHHLQSEVERFIDNRDSLDEHTHRGHVTRELLLAKYELARRLLEHDYSHRLQQAPTTTASELKDGTSSEKLSSIFERYIDLRGEKTGQIVEKSETTYRDQFQPMLELVGDIPINKFTKEKGRAYVDGLLDYPLKRSSGKRAAMTLDEARKATKKRLATSTVNNHITNNTTFLGWATNQGYIASNPLKGLSVKVDKSENSRDAFKSGDLELIFSQPRFKGEKPSKRHALRAEHYWLPLLGLFTGARMEEICRLRKCDIQMDGITPVMELMNPELAPELSTRRRKKAGKNTFSNRFLPIHPTLWQELDFKDYVNSRTDGYLFDLREYKGKRGHYVSQDFSRFKKSKVLGKNLSNEPDLAFHSFRHTMRNLLTKNRVDSPNVKAIAGHSMKGDVTYDIYGDPLSQQPLLLAEDIFPINFSEFLSEVKPWREIKHAYEN